MVCNTSVFHVEHSRNGKWLSQRELAGCNSVELLHLEADESRLDGGSKADSSRAEARSA
jgi:hypothetical protein